MPIPAALVVAGAGTEGPGTPGEILHTGSATIGGITLGVTDDYGVEWIFETITGWFDPPSTTGASEQRASDHGGWSDVAYYTTRTVEITGTLLASDWTGASNALTRLFAAIPLSDRDWIYIDEGDDRILQSKVRQDGDPLVTRLNGWARFSLSLTADDPRRYANDQTVRFTGLPQTTGGVSFPLGFPLGVPATVSSGLLSLVNDGNMATRPVFAVTGPCPAFTITQVETGRGISALNAVPAGHTLYLDVDARTALLDGTSQQVVTGTWFDLEPGLNTLLFNAATYDPAASLAVSYRSAWR